LPRFGGALYFRQFLFTTRVPCIAGFDDDGDAVVVAVDKPVKRHVGLMTGNHSNKNHYNNCSGDKQSNSQTLIPLAAIPHKEACHQ
jgi:hypothetical protein